MAWAAGATQASTATFDEAGWRVRLARNRENFLQFLASSPTSYFAAVSRTDFGGRTSLVVGSGPADDVHVEAPGIVAGHLRVTATDTGFTLRTAAGATVRVDGRDVTEATLAPAAVGLARFTLRLSHQGHPAIVVFDPDAKAAAPHAPPEWFPPDPAFRVVATLTPAPARDEVTIQSTRGTPRKALRLGTFVFTLAGTPCTLEANRLLEPGVGEEDVSVFFRDTTTGHESYPVGRYVDPRRQPDGTWLLDFNFAYNPACAYSPHYNCPIPPRSNTLGVAVRAGEKTTH